MEPGNWPRGLAFPLKPQPVMKEGPGMSATGLVRQALPENVRAIWPPTGEAGRFEPAA